MKTSNKLLFILVTVLFMGILASSMVLKSEFEKIDRDNPFYGYAQENLEPFTAVKLSGNYPHLVQLQQGDTYELLTTHDARPNLLWEVKDDTLVISIQYPESNSSYNQNYAFYDNHAGVNIIAPHLSALFTEGITCRLSGWDEAQMSIHMKGYQRGILLKENTIAQLSASIRQGGLVLLDENNKVELAKIEVRDSSTFTAGYAAIDSLNINVDQTAQVKLPGYLLSRLVP
ncbi:hypothetical protein OKW21_000222 [Catalinimonas alkaloidigena]|uniref:hypothetical protein n=1 Tax=Catalinimonas alkaloidigena TaxID=1075417 RepID=UPI002406A023|nr:hypothetical protein [Catalinimonas alkaloidigena]MDF9794959.1 hypothetical protein [Catalinimonas alkaloidigena]